MMLCINIRSFILSFFLSLLFQFSDGQAMTFCNRIYHSSIVVNNTLMVDGGELRQLNVSSGGVNASLPGTINMLDLSKPWSNADPPNWDYVSKNGNGSNPGPPTLNEGAIFSNGSNIWLYGGAVSLINNPPPIPPPNGVWTYNKDKNVWSKASPGGDPIQRLLVGMTVSDSRGMAYYLGGAKAPLSDPAFNAQQDVEPYMVQGLLKFDQSKQIFRNSSTIGMNQDNTVGDGFLSIIETLGSHGVLIAFGGFTNSAGVGMRLRDSDLRDSELRWQMQNIAVYDIANQKWYNQQATGDVPSWRYNGCSVVASAPDGSSHSIYVFGGWGGTNVQKNDGNVYVLSLPSFTWIRVTEDFDQRARHKCHLMGKHHMLVVGGIRPNGDDSQPEDAVGCDTNPKFSQGLGIFSLNDHNWTANYDPKDGASPYLVNPSIFKVIGGDETGGATKQTPTKGFSSDALRILLRVSAPSSSSSSTGPKSIPSPTVGVISVASSPSLVTTMAAKASQSINGKDIAGTIVGVAGATLLIAAIVFFLLRRRRRRNRHASPILQTSHMSRPPLNRYYTELDATSQPQELLGGSREESLAKQYASHELMSSPGKRPLPDPPTVRVDDEADQSSKGSEHIVSPVDDEVQVVQPLKVRARDVLRGSEHLPLHIEEGLSARHSSWDRRARW